jgi:hypothetical protein
MWSRLVSSKTNDFKLELVRLSVNSGSGDVMTALWRENDLSFWHAKRSKWRSNADTFTSDRVRDKRHGKRGAVGSAVSLTSVFPKSKLSRHLILPHLSNTFT